MATRVIEQSLLELIRELGEHSLTVSPVCIPRDHLTATTGTQVFGHGSEWSKSKSKVD
jgi:hypothetical protein